MGVPTGGILLLDKPAGKTSFDVVRQVKGILRSRKVGHGGTLDPFATGLLMILVGQGTKLSDFLMGQDKVYRGIITLGVETDTSDPTGKVIRSVTIPELEIQEIRARARAFLGEIYQVPPPYSAVKHRGTRAYRLARRGIRVPLKARKVRIHDFKVLEVRLPDIYFEVRCSKGTYIRTLASDFGKNVGTGAYLKSLVRTAIGPFHLGRSVKWSSLEKPQTPDGLIQKMISLRDALPSMEELEVDFHMAKRLRQGHQPTWRDLGGRPVSRVEAPVFLKAVYKGELVAVIERTAQGPNEKCKPKLRRVFM